MLQKYCCVLFLVKKKKKWKQTKNLYEIAFFLNVTFLKDASDYSPPQFHFFYL